MTENSNAIRAFSEFSSALGNIPEMQTALAWAEREPGQVQEIAAQYMTLLRAAAQYSKEEIGQINSARALMAERDVRLHSASTLNTANFLGSASAAGTFPGAIKNLFQASSTHHTDALKGLAAMMQKGSEIAKGSETPKDGDPVWDEVIWGHTQAKADTDPAVLIHFIFVHYVCQYMNRVLGQAAGLTEKDSFINVLADIVLFETARGQLSESIYKTWSATKENGGLGWVDDNQLVLYREVLS